MDDEVQAILDKAHKSLKRRGYDFRMILSYQKEGLGGRHTIINVPMPKRGQASMQEGSIDYRSELLALVELLRIEIALLKGLDEEFCQRVKRLLDKIRDGITTAPI